MGFIGLNKEHIHKIQINLSSIDPGLTFSPYSDYNMFMLMFLKTAVSVRFYLKISQMKFCGFTA